MGHRPATLESLNTKVETIQKVVMRIDSRLNQLESLQPSDSAAGFPSTSFGNSQCKCDSFIEDVNVKLENINQEITKTRDQNNILYRQLETEIHSSHQDLKNVITKTGRQDLAGSGNPTQNPTASDIIEHIKKLYNLLNPVMLEVLKKSTVLVYAHEKLCKNVQDQLSSLQVKSRKTLEIDTILLQSDQMQSAVLQSLVESFDGRTPGTSSLTTELEKLTEIQSSIQDNASNVKELFDENEKRITSLQLELTKLQTTGDHGDDTEKISEKLEHLDKTMEELISRDVMKAMETADRYEEIKKLISKFMSKNEAFFKTLEEAITEEQTSTARSGIKAYKTKKDFPKEYDYGRYVAKEVKEGTRVKWIADAHRGVQEGDTGSVIIGKAWTDSVGIDYVKVKFDKSGCDLGVYCGSLEIID